MEKGVVGCEGVWGTEKRGCYAITKNVDQGDGEKSHMCWKFPDTGINIDAFEDFCDSSSDFRLS